MAITKVCGIETEYGIQQRGTGESNPIAASSVLINAYVAELTRRVGWDFEDESPGNDARGFARDGAMAPEVETHLVNAVLSNGARYYVDHAHPEYSSPECINALQAVLFDKAGERILLRSMEAAARSLPNGQGIVVYKNNSDGKGNSYGTHENYLMDRAVPFGRIVQHVMPHFVTRQLFTGAGKVGTEAASTNGIDVTYQLSQRADFFEEEVGLETTLKRPIVNTRDEPHADAERYRRLHVIAGDSNMSEYATYVKVGTVVALLQMIERDTVFRDLTLENPIRAIREIAHDITCRRKVRLAHGRELSALDIQWEYFERVSKFARNPGFAPEVQAAVDRWEHLLTGLEKDPLSLDREVDWVIKYRLLERYREQRGLALSHPRLAMLDLSYHDVDRARGVYNMLARQDMVDRVLSDGEISRAAVLAPQTTRARLRGEFIKAAKAKRRDFTVDWVHLKLNDQAQRTVLCKDPFKSHDERVDRLIESL